MLYIVVGVGGSKLYRIVIFQMLYIVVGVGSGWLYRIVIF